MAAVCDICAKKPMFGNNRPWSKKITKRRFDPNIQSKRYWLPSEGRYVRLVLSTKGIKTVDRLGIEKTVQRLRAQGVKV